MHEGTAPANIVDKNGRATVVWRRVQPVTPLGSAPAAPPASSGALQYLDDDHLTAFFNVQPLRIPDESAFSPHSGFRSQFVVQPTTNPVLLGSAVWDSLNRMAKDDRGIEYLAYDIEISGKVRTVHFVGTDLESKLELFQKWAEEGAGSRDHHAFPENFSGDAVEWEQKTKAWFAPEMDIAWALEEEHAQRLIKAVSPY